jgi:hypothetical protein
MVLYMPSVICCMDKFPNFFFHYEQIVFCYILSKNKWFSTCQASFTAWIPPVLHVACHIFAAVSYLSGVDVP